MADDNIMIVMILMKLIIMMIKNITTKFLVIP